MRRNTLLWEPDFRKVKEICKVRVYEIKTRAHWRFLGRGRGRRLWIGIEVASRETLLNLHTNQISTFSLDLEEKHGLNSLFPRLKRKEKLTWFFGHIVQLCVFYLFFLFILLYWACIIALPNVTSTEFWPMVIPTQKYQTSRFPTECSYLILSSYCSIRKDSHARNKLKRREKTTKKPLLWGSEGVK